MNEKTGEVLVAEDDASLRTVMIRALERAGLRAAGAPDLAAAREYLEAGIPRVMITDLRLPDGSGLGLLRELRGEPNAPPVILVTAYTDLDAAVAAFDAGAFDYLPKPFDLDELVTLVRRALDSRDAPEARHSGSPPQILGRSRAMQPVFRAIGRLASSSVPVLVTGPTGSGKELVARALHRHGDRSGGPFVAVNMAAVPRELLEAELFGHEKGAFTGAHSRRQGRFEQAAGGTLFLDEIGDMPEVLQTRLLRVLSEGEYYRVGGTEKLRSEARIVAATHQDLAKKVDRGRFREDLLHRLDVVRIGVPGLAERPEDIGVLADHFLGRAALEGGLSPKRLSSEALERLQRRSWPGNVRELENLCRRLTALTPGPVIHPDDLPKDAGAEVAPADDRLQQAVGRWFHQRREESGTVTWGEAAAILESELIRQALSVTDGNRQEAARLLGMGRNTLARKLREGK